MMLRLRLAARAILIILALPMACQNSKTSEPASSPGGAGQTNTEQGLQPAAITGGNLADYNSTRVRCDYQAAQTANTYNAQCSVVTHQSNGQEYFASGLASSVTLSWQPPAAVSGNLSFNNCNPQANQLSYRCAVTVNSTATPAQASFSVQVKDDTNAARTESASLMLPYSVGVAGGFVPSMPFQYVSQSSIAAAPSTSSEAGNQLGFQQFSFPPSLTSTPYPVGIASCGSTLYYSSGSAIFKVVNHTVSYFAGSPNFQDAGNITTDAMRVYIVATGLTCAADGGIYADSGVTRRIYKITPAGVISLVAGNGSAGVSNDGGLAVNSQLNDPTGMALNSKGELIFAERANGLIRKVTNTGLLATVAGSGSTGYAGDGGPATAAALTMPGGIAVGPDDSIYVADQGVAVVRKIAPNGIITTIAGTGTTRYNDPSNNPLDLAEPVSVFVDKAGAVYVGEAYRGIKKIGAGGTFTQLISNGPDVASSAPGMIAIIQQLAATRQHSPDASIVNGRPGFYYVALGADGTIYTDGPEGVLAFPPQATSPTIFVGATDAAPADCGQSQPAFMTRLYDGSALAIMPNHTLAVLDYASQSADQLVLHTFSLGTGPSPDTSRATLGCSPTPQLMGFNQYSFLSGIGATVNTIGAMVAGSDGSLYIANEGQNLIVKISPQGVPTTLAGTGTAAYTADGTKAATASIQTPVSVALGADGSVYFTEIGVSEVQASTDGSRIRRISPSGILSTIAGNGRSGDSGEDLPAAQAVLTATGIATSKDGRIFIADYYNNKIKMIDAQGVMHTIAGGGTLAISTGGIPALQAQLANPTSLAVTNDGTLYFVNFGSNQVLEMKINSDGSWNVMTFFGAQRTTDCGTSKISGIANSNSIASAVNSSLSIICQGVPRSITISDTCPSVGGDTRIAILQGVDAFANIVEVVQPCGT